MVSKIVFASNNEHKLKEVREILKDIEILPAKSVIDKFEVEENGKSFCENSLIKAKALSKFTDLPVLADDSGLEVFSLNKEPGIYSSRYAGTGRDEDNIKKLLENLKNKTDKKARFTCCMTLIIGDKIIQKEGYVYGVIIDKPKGKNGFGYDPIFIPDGFDITFAEMKPDEKNKLSHRKRALELIKKELENANI
ncbi:RdgB/HAM1 family non-canonical purine NTP pyrophosphatase [Hippea alviniae]|uniref:RdgB/HAM1 family non-canonical purine NTP pyrophosphatase n=1 Tax=Hippea alviniae TaxID=1279027 RepID=UPI0003B5BA2F|nr:RdgB/HAM1 family non-canonical purine NTP pyrophosphatase [Hippea alviniae]